MKVVPVINSSVWTIISPTKIKIGDIIRFLEKGKSDYGRAFTVVGIRKSKNGIYIRYKGHVIYGFIDFSNKNFTVQRKII